MIPATMRPYLSTIKGFEGTYPHMYVDPNGYVTIGTGHNLSAYHDATRYVFDQVRDQRKAINGDTGPAPTGGSGVFGVSDLMIEQEYAFMTKHAGFLKTVQQGVTQTTHPQKPYTTLEISQTTINMIFEADIDHVINKIVLMTHEFRDFETFPGSAQAGIVDLGFNVKNFPHHWDNFKANVMARDWKAAASSSHRKDTYNGVVLGGLVKRNAQVRQWFEEAAREDPIKVDFVGTASNLA